jgi:hypothetical protein
MPKINAKIVIHSRSEAKAMKRFFSQKPLVYEGNPFSAGFDPSLWTKS